MRLRNKKTGEILEDKCLNYVLDDMKQYNSLAELNDEWEDYKTTEPYIDNEEIREIIRAWAKVNGATVLTYDAGENSLRDIFRNEISFNRALGLKDCNSYSVNELCGEEEE